MKSSLALAGKPLDVLLGESGGNAVAEGALTVVLGGMSAGKNAVGLAYARTVLHHGGFVLVCQPGDRGKFATRVPAELDRRLGSSVMRLADVDKDWRERLHVLTPAAVPEPQQQGGSARGSAGFAGVLAQGPLFPEEAARANWRNRMVVIQDYNLLWRTEQDLTPARLRALALHHRINIVLLADTTGGDREIARLPASSTSSQDAALISLLRPLIEDERLSGDELDFVREQFPHIAAAAESGRTPQSAAPLPARSVRVHPGQVLLAEAAHRLVYVEKATADTLMLHTLKSQQLAPPSKELELDAGYLAWPPDRLQEQPRHIDRERMPQGDLPRGTAREDSSAESAPRG
jgi:hypothetical protein